MCCRFRVVKVNFGKETIGGDHWADRNVQSITARQPPPNIYKEGNGTQEWIACATAPN